MLTLLVWQSVIHLLNSGASPSITTLLKSSSLSRRIACLNAKTSASVGLTSGINATKLLKLFHLSLFGPQQCYFSLSLMQHPH